MDAKTHRWPSDDKRPLSTDPVHYKGKESLQSWEPANPIFTGLPTGRDAAHLSTCEHALEMPHGTSGCSGQKHDARPRREPAGSPGARRVLDWLPLLTSANGRQRKAKEACWQRRGFRIKRLFLLRKKP